MINNCNIQCCRCPRWFINTRRGDLKWPTDRSRIKKLALCEDHFDERQYMNPADKFCTRPRKRLRHDAVPTIFNLPANASLPTSVKPTIRKPNRLQLCKLSNCQELSSSVAEESELVPPTPCTSAITGDRLESLTCRSSQITPRKRKLKLEINRSRVSLSRLRKRLAVSNNLVNTFRQRDNRAALIENLQTFISGPAYDFCVAQIKLGHLRKKQRRWSCKMKLFCVSLFFKSPSAYRFLSKTFCLPTVRSLHRIFLNVNINPGFSNELFEVLQHRVQLISDKDKFCTICID